MGLREFFLWQLEHEAATSRKVIERVPEGKTAGSRTSAPWSWATWPPW